MVNKLIISILVLLILLIILLLTMKLSIFAGSVEALIF